jgi:hypothetical protein
MASRSRRGSTMASSIATQSLARQRDEMHEADVTGYPTGKRKASRKKIPSEPKPKKPRRPRRWAPAGWGGNRWSARSIHPGGLETTHEPDMSSFRTNGGGTADASTASTGLSWLRPQNRVSIWEHLAAIEQRAGREAASSPPAPGNECAVVSAPVSAFESVGGEGTSKSPTVCATGSHAPAGPCAQVAARPLALHCAAGDGKPSWPEPIVDAEVSRQISACGSAGGDVHDPPAASESHDAVLTTPAASSSAHRVSILSLVGAA